MAATIVQVPVRICLLAHISLTTKMHLTPVVDSENPPAHTSSVGSKGSLFMSQKKRALR